MLDTPLGADQVCPNCHLFHHHGDCSSSGSSQEQERPKFTRRGEYCGLGEEAHLCGSKVILLTCEKYLDEYGKRLFCGREWCPNCGRDESDMHKRRYARLMDKVFYLGDCGKGHGLGYFIFTIPVQVRDSFRSKGRLGKAGSACREILQEHGFYIGLSRWHYFGDGEVVETEILDLGEYHPHLNCLVPGRWIRDEELSSIKEAWRRYLEEVSGDSIDVAVVHYKYYKSKSQWWHKGKYVTRSTFKELSGNEKLAERLFGFRNINYWGWGQGDKKEEKLKRGKVVLGLWLDDMKGKDREDVITRKEFDELVSISHMRCIKCMEQGRGFVRIITYQDFNTGCRKVANIDDVLPRIERKLSGGFFILRPIILNKKPVFSDVGDEEEGNGAYDTS